MNYRLLSRLLGLLLTLLSGAMALCLAYAWWDHERRPGLDVVESFLLSVLVTAGSGAALWLAGRRSGKELLRKEAIALVGLGWVVCAGFGAIPYMLCEPSLTVSGAFFESMSGFTTTGSTVIAGLTQFPKANFRAMKRPGQQHGGDGQDGKEFLAAAWRRRRFAENILSWVFGRFCHVLHFKHCRRQRAASQCT